MSGQRLEPDREAAIRRKRAACSEIEREGGTWSYKPVALRLADVDALLAELDAVRADLAAAKQDALKTAEWADREFGRAERAEASLALVEGQAHRATQALTASTELLALIVRDATRSNDPAFICAGALADAQVQVNQVALGLTTAEGNK